MKWPGPWLHAKDADEKLQCLCGGCQKRVSGAPLPGCLGTRIQSAEQSQLPPDTLTGTWHPRTAPALRAGHVNTASLHALQQDGANLGWGSVVCQIPKSPNPASKGCCPGNATLIASKAPVFVRPVSPRLCKWSRLVLGCTECYYQCCKRSRRQLERERYIYIYTHRHLLWVLPSCSSSGDFALCTKKHHSCLSVRSSSSP